MYFTILFSKLLVTDWRLLLKFQFLNIYFTRYSDQNSRNLEHSNSMQMRNLLLFLGEQTMM